jgi:hypothetical protein
MLQFSCDPCAAPWTYRRKLLRLEDPQAISTQVGRGVDQGCDQGGIRARAGYLRAGVLRQLSEADETVQDEAVDESRGELLV